MATIKDVAEAAGVSKAAVSRILNHKGPFSTATITRVEEAARALGYTGTVSQNADRGLKSICAILPSLTSPYFGALAVALEREAHAYGYTLVLRSSNFERAREPR